MLAISRAGRAFSVFVLCSPVLARAEDPLPRVLTTVAGFDNGEDAPLRDIVISGSMGITFDAAGNLYFTDLHLGVVRRMDAATGRVRTVVGTGRIDRSGPETTALTTSLSWPWDVAFDGNGVMYIADFGHQRILAYNGTDAPVVAATIPLGPGEIGTIAGTGELTPWECHFPGSPCAGVLGNGGPATEATFGFPRGLAIDGEGNVFVADIDNLQIRRIDAVTGIIDTVAGDGDVACPTPAEVLEGTAAVSVPVCFPGTVILAPGGGFYFGSTVFNDQGEGGVVWRVDVDGGLHAVAGAGVVSQGGDGGDALAAGMTNPNGLAEAGGDLYISDGDRIRRVDAAGTIDTVAGGLDRPGAAYTSEGLGGPPRGVLMGRPGELAFHDGDLYFTEETVGAIRVVRAHDGRVAGDPRERLEELGSAAGMKKPWSIAFDPAGRLFASEGWRNRVLAIDRRGAVTPLVNQADVFGTAGVGGPAGVAQSGWSNAGVFDERGDYYFTDGANRRILRLRSAAARSAEAPSIGPETELELVATLPFTVFLDHLAVARGHVYVSSPIDNQIWEVTPQGETRLFAGNGSYGGAGDGGPAAEAQLAEPNGVAVDPREDLLYIADLGNRSIRRVDLRTGIIDTLTVIDGPEESGYFSIPQDVLLVGDFLFVADAFNQEVWRVDLQDPGTPRVVAGSGEGFPIGFWGDEIQATSGRLEWNLWLGLDPAGKVHLLETNVQRVRRMGIVDILPGAFPNHIQRGSPAAVEVAVLSSWDFDATTVDPTGVTVAGAPCRPARRSRRDVDGDGRPDLVVETRARQMALTTADREAAVELQLPDGRVLHDADWVTVH